MPHTMQAAIGLSPTNKACTTLDNGDIFAIEEYMHEKYRIWLVPVSEIAIHAGLLYEDEIDMLAVKFRVEPGNRIWESMGVLPDLAADYQAIEVALQALADQIVALRTELLVIKALLEEQKGD
jgi:hypothetical protein